MLPSEIRAEQFDRYPPLARDLAVRQIGLLRRLPLGYVSLLLREVITYDWKFPVERHEVGRDFEYLGGLSAAAFDQEMAAFRSLKLSRELEAFDWVNSPVGFSEKLTAHLWASHQIDSFRAAAVGYMNRRSAATKEILPSGPRLAIAVIGQGVSAESNTYKLFRKLRPQGTYFNQVKPGGGLAAILAAAMGRSEANPAPFRHWYIDGGSAAPSAGLAQVSYQSLAPMRESIQKQMQKAYESEIGAEAMRSLLARMKPEDLGADSTAAPDPILLRFNVSLLTEGSGTQVFSTTFVQWAAREALRRAQPETLVVRFAPRQRERPMNELLAEARSKPGVDPQGSLIDADMGAYYTWLNLQRLPGDQPPRFLAWFEDQREAVAIGPQFAAGKTISAPVDLASIIPA